MNKAAVFVCIHVFFLSGLAKLAYAAHPLVTDDTSTQGQDHNQIEVNSDWARSAGDSRHVGALTYSYGVTDELDLFGTIPVNISSPSGKGDVSFGAKWRYWEGRQLSLAVKPELFLPTGNELSGLGNGSPSLGLTVLASHTYRRWGFDGNIGFMATHDKAPSFNDARHAVIWRASAALTYRLNPHWVVVADTGIARNSEKAAKINPAFVLLGAIYLPRQNFAVDMGIKAGLNAAEVDRQVGMGVTVRF